MDSAKWSFFIWPPSQQNPGLETFIFDWSQKHLFFEKQMGVFFSPTPKPSKSWTWGFNFTLEKAKFAGFQYKFPPHGQVLMLISTCISVADHYTSYRRCLMTWTSPQKIFRYLRPKGTNLEILRCRNFGVPLDAHTLFFFANPLYTCCTPKKILLACWKVKVQYPVIHGFGGRTKKNFL